MKNNVVTMKRFLVLLLTLILAAAFLTALNNEDSFAKGSKTKSLAGGSSSTAPAEGFENDDSNFGSFSPSGSYPTIAPGEQKDCDIDEDEKIITYKFTAPADGVYIFYSKDNSGDPIGRVVGYDSTAGSFRQMICSDDEDGVSNFRAAFRAKAGQDYYLQARMYGSGQGMFSAVLEQDIYTASINVTADNKTGMATVTGTCTGDTFDELYVDGDSCKAGISGQNSFSIQIDLKDYSIGSHKIYAVLENHNSEADYVYNAEPVTTLFYDKPSNKLDYYYTGPKDITFTYNGDHYYYSYDYRVYAEYKEAGGNWKTATDSVDKNGSMTIKGLKPGKAYSVRTYFATEVEQDGRKQFISGRDNGFISNTVTVKTGGAKPAIKSIKITKVKQKSYTYSQPIWQRYWYGTMLIMRIVGYKKVKAYKTKFKVTVNMKKKPGASGIEINGKKLKGNKKKYTTSFELDGKKKGKKFLIKICSYQSKIYGGYSKLAKKKVKIR